MIAAGYLKGAGLLVDRYFVGGNGSVFLPGGAPNPATNEAIARVPCLSALVMEIEECIELKYVLLAGLNK
jgi:hypothetical protein